MAERKVVFDFHNTLVARPNYFIRRDHWMRGRHELLRELGQLGCSIAIWTADYTERFADSTSKLVPALLGVAKGGITDEFYTVDRLPEIPEDFEIRNDRSSVHEYIHYIAPASSHDPKINEPKHAIGNVVYDREEEFLHEVDKHLLRYHMRHGVKIPPVIGSRVLVDDLAGSRYFEGGQLHHYSRLYQFNLVNPQRNPHDLTTNRWIDRMVEEIMTVL